MEFNIGRANHFRNQDGALKKRSKSKSKTSIDSTNKDNDNGDHDQENNNNNNNNNTNNKRGNSASISKWIPVQIMHRGITIDVSYKIGNRRYTATQLRVSADNNIRPAYGIAQGFQDNPLLLLTDSSDDDKYDSDGDDNPYDSDYKSGRYRSKRSRGRPRSESKSKVTNRILQDRKNKNKSKSKSKQNNKHKDNSNVSNILLPVKRQSVRLALKKSLLETQGNENSTKTDEIDANIIVTNENEKASENGNEKGDGDIETKNQEEKHDNQLAMAEEKTNSSLRSELKDSVKKKENDNEKEKEKEKEKNKSNNKRNGFNNIQINETLASAWLRKGSMIEIYLAENDAWIRAKVMMVGKYLKFKYYTANGKVKEDSGYCVDDMFRLPLAAIPKSHANCQAPLSEKLQQDDNRNENENEKEKEMEVKHIGRTVLSITDVGRNIRMRWKTGEWYEGRISYVPCHKETGNMKDGRFCVVYKDLFCETVVLDINTLFYFPICDIMDIPSEHMHGLKPLCDCGTGMIEVPGRMRQNTKHACSKCFMQVSTE